MCGITGALWFQAHAEVAQATLDRMVDSLAHRGPDDRGTYISPLTRDAAGDIPGVGLGFRRLSIIDLQGGHQPMTNEDQTIWMVFNGEIYNYRDLRKRLEGSGHRFESESDSETIVHLYEDLGTKCFEHLNGMFAIAIWDSRKRQLVLARDRLGKKPLFYQLLADQLLFGSELKSLAQASSFNRDVSFAAIDAFLTYQYVPHPSSIFSHTRKVPPGNFIVFRDGSQTAQPESFWNVNWSEESEMSKEEAITGIKDLLADSIRLRLRSDVPLGAFLSGGVDSSLIVALAQKELSQPLHTFSIGFDQADFDETGYAQQVAQWVGTEHHEHKIAANAIDTMEQIVTHFDEPFGDSSALPTWHLCKWTRQHVTVALSGDGGDELFAGYDRYRALWMSRWVNELLPLRPILGSSLIQRLPASNRQRSFVRRLQRFGQALSEPQSRRYMNWIQIFPERMRVQLYRSEFIEQLPDEDPFEFFEKAWESVGKRDLVSRASLADLTTYLPCDLMTKVDIASMAHALECRQPFLDYRLVEFAARMPSRLKFSFWGSKLILRQAFDRELPRQIWTRKKMGFGVPIAKWFQNELRSFVEDHLIGSDVRCHRYFQADGLKQIVQQHMSGRVNHCYRLWNLLVLELWMRRWLA